MFWLSRRASGAPVFDRRHLFLLSFRFGVDMFFCQSIRGDRERRPYPKYGEKEQKLLKLYEDFGREKEEVIEKIDNEPKGGQRKSQN